MSERDEFLYTVREYVKRDPEVAGYIGMAVAEGLRHTLEETRERAADMEIVASVLLERKFKGRDNLIKSKLEKWRNKCAVRWDWYLENDDGRY